MKLVKKAFIGASVIFTLIVILLTVATTLVTTKVTDHTTERVTTCYADGTHCKTTVTHK